MRRKVWATIVAVAAGAVAVGVIVVAGGSGNDGVTVAAGSADTGSANEASTTTVSLDEPVPTTVPAVTPPPAVPPPAAGPTTAPAAPAPTTTAPKPTTTTSRSVPTTTTTKPARTVTVTKVGWSDPNLPGKGYFNVMVRGTGCAGAENGWGFGVYDPNGQQFDGDGGQAYPDGNWEMKFDFYSAHAPGRYTFKATCSVANGPLLFAYPPAYFDWTGAQP
jgi:hypothetical protein